jgi:phage shock protein C
MTNPTQRLMRSRSDKIVAGVAGGIAQYLAVDPVFVRLAFVIAGLSGIGLLLYPILWLIMPVEGGSGSAPDQALGEMRHQAARVGEEVREVFVTTASGTRRARFDPMTGQPIDEGDEIPINNVGGSGQQPAQRRNQLLGVVLVTIGAIIAVNAIAPGAGRYIIPALMVVGGVLLLKRSR